MSVQYFKGDDQELKFYESAAPLMDATSADLSRFSEGAYTAADFLLMLYDEGRFPFSDRVPREAFVAFILGCISNSNFIGTYESYIFLVQSIFGAQSLISFDETDPGVLNMTVSTSSSLAFDFVVLDGSTIYSLVTAEGETLSLFGIAGIENEAELNALLAEFVPAGIYPNIELVLFSTSLFLVDDGGDYTIVDDDANDIIFFELGG